MLKKIPPSSYIRNKQAPLTSDQGDASALGVESQGETSAKGARPHKDNFDIQTEDIDKTTTWHVGFTPRTVWSRNVLVKSVCPDAVNLNGWRHVDGRSSEFRAR